MYPMMGSTNDTNRTQKHTHEQEKANSSWHRVINAASAFGGCTIRYAPAGCD